MKKSTVLLGCIFSNTAMCYVYPKESAFYIVAFVCISAYFIVKTLEEKL